MIYPERPLLIMKFADGSLYCSDGYIVGVHLQRFDELRAIVQPVPWYQLEGFKIGCVVKAEVKHGHNLMRSCQGCALEVDQLVIGGEVAHYDHRTHLSQLLRYTV